MASTTQTFQMPDWYPHLNKDTILMLSPFEHFGSGWGKIQADNQTVELHVTTTGKWHVLISASRKDPHALTCPQEVEWQEEIDNDPPPRNYD